VANPPPTTRTDGMDTRVALLPLALVKLPTLRVENTCVNVIVMDVEFDFVCRVLSDCASEMARKPGRVLSKRTVTPYTNENAVLRTTYVRYPRREAGRTNEAEAACSRGISKSRNSVAISVDVEIHSREWRMTTGDSRSWAVTSIIRPGARV